MLNYTKVEDKYIQQSKFQKEKGEKMNNKDAYLILAHKVDYTFETLLTLLDSEKNDIYIHMDKKTKQFNEQDIKNKMKKSNVFFVDRIKCNWGGFSLVKAELNLLKYATKNNYRYYHLISGQDLPLKTQDEIYEFFKKNQGKEFIDFQEEKFNYKKRVKYYYPFQEMLGRDSTKKFYGKLLTKSILKFQDIFKLYRNKKIIFQKGAQWVSITNKFAKYVISKEKEINKTFKNTFCPDELVIQTLFINSEFKENLYSNEYNNQEKTIKRCIDWNRGKPYTWKKENFKELINSEALFARKFDENIDKGIITKIKQHLQRGE